MKIVLSEASADVLARVEGMRRWYVAPTMTRGSKKMGDNSTQKKPEKNKGQPKAKTSLVLKKTKKRIRKSKAPKVSTLSIGEITSESFRGNVAGRNCITLFMEKIYSLDVKVFGMAPAFAENEICRLKFPGAGEFKWPEILEIAPKDIEFMYPACIRQMNSTDGQTIL